MTATSNRSSARQTGHQVAESLSACPCLPVHKSGTPDSGDSNPDTPKPCTLEASNATSEAMDERASWPAMGRMERLESMSRAKADVPPPATSTRFRRFIDSLSREDYAVYEADQAMYSPGQYYYVPQWRLDELQAQSGAQGEKGGSLGNEQGSALNGAGLPPAICRRCHVPYAMCRPRRLP